MPERDLLYEASVGLKDVLSMICDQLVAASGVCPSDGIYVDAD